MEYKKLVIDPETERKTVEKIDLPPAPVQRKYGEPPNYERFSFIDIHWGPVNAKDYGWHFAPWHAQRPFEADLTYACRVIMTFLAPLVPKHIKVDVLLPPVYWETKIITVIAKNANSEWTFDEERINEAIPKIAAMLNDYVTQVGQRRRRAL